MFMLLPSNALEVGDAHVVGVPHHRESRWGCCLVEGAPMGVTVAWMCVAVMLLNGLSLTLAVFNVVLGDR